MKFTIKEVENGVIVTTQNDYYNEDGLRIKDSHTEQYVFDDMLKALTLVMGKSDFVDLGVLTSPNEYFLEIVEKRIDEKMEYAFWGYPDDDFRKAVNKWFYSEVGLPVVSDIKEAKNKVLIVPKNGLIAINAELFDNVALFCCLEMEKEDKVTDNQLRVKNASFYRVKQYKTE